MKRLRTRVITERSAPNDRGAFYVTGFTTGEVTDRRDTSTRTVKTEESATEIAVMIHNRSSANVGSSPVSAAASWMFGSTGERLPSMQPDRSPQHLTINHKFSYDGEPEVDAW